MSFEPLVDMNHQPQDLQSVHYHTLATAGIEPATSRLEAAVWRCTINPIDFVSYIFIFLFLGKDSKGQLEPPLDYNQQPQDLKYVH